MQLDEELLPLEAELPDLGPGEGVDLAKVLEDEHARVGHSQVERDAVMVLQATKKHYYQRHTKTKSPDSSPPRFLLLFSPTSICIPGAHSLSVATLVVVSHRRGRRLGLLKGLHITNMSLI